MLINQSARIACAVSSFAFLILATNVNAADSRARQRALDPKTVQLPARSDPNHEIEVFVRLDEPAVAELNLQTLEQTGRFAAQDQQKSQAARVTAQQSAFKPSLQSLGARVLSAHRVGANGFRVLVKPSELAQLKRLPGVRSVGRVALHRPDNAESVPWIGAPAVWNSVGKGEGVKIGIIDTGIDYTHANFGGSGDPADYTANNPLVVEPGSFPVPGGAVRGGIDLAGANYDASNPSSDPVPDADPLDGAGHGTHVAGTAAGRGVSGSIGPGVAPGADLYAIKIFGDNGGSTDLTSLGIEWAMDPNGDGDMSDHLDVINMSLGSNFGDPNDPSVIASENAAKLGIVVVASAGNSGAIPYIIGAPSIASSAISVAASVPGGRLYPSFSVTAPSNVAGLYPSAEGQGPVTIKAAGPISGVLAPTVPADGCAPVTNDVSGKIALVARGTCTFLIKYQNAQAAGAKAIVVYNNVSGAPSIMGFLDSTVTIPGLMIADTSGQKLKDVAGVQALLASMPDPAVEDAITAFSSQGPARGDSGFKPDLSAPGFNIVSSLVGGGTSAATASGTSMAAPHVTGAAALLRQEHPKLDPAAIKALLQNSTVTANATADTRLTVQGTGVVRVDRASKLTSFAKPGGVSFGRLNTTAPVLRSEKLELTNLTPKPRFFTSKHIPNRTAPGVTVVCPSFIGVGGSRTAKTEILLTYDPFKSVKSGQSDNGSVSQTEVDGWCVLSDGTDELRVGYIAVIDPASSVIVTGWPHSNEVTVRNLGPASGFAEGFTLAKLGGDYADDTESSISALGFRRADPNKYDSTSVLEFGVATKAPFNTLSSLYFDMLIDSNQDGVTDVELMGIDLSRILGLATGTYATIQFNGTRTAGFVDEIVTTWDYNDRTFILPFTLEAGGGWLPEKFNYSLHLFGGDGSEDVQEGSVDLSKEIVPDLNSFSVAAGEAVKVQMSGGTGSSLWLMPNNRTSGQMNVTTGR
jgi:subtilisin family serine protease